MIGLVGLLLFLGGSALAQTPNPADPRLRTIPYDANQVVPLQVPTNFQSTVIFGPDERVENVAIGDSNAWQVTLNQAGDALFIKPLNSSGPTNMTVITDMRIYSFELSSAYGPTPEAPFMVRFQYPDASSDRADSGQPRLGSYRISGARGLRPLAIADDGVHTSIEWRPDQTIPAVFAIDDRGMETLVEGHMRDGLYVIDSVHRALVFRLDGKSARATRVRVRTRR